MQRDDIIGTSIEPIADRLQRTRSASKLISLQFAAFSGGPDAKRSKASGFWFLPSTTIVFAPVRIHFPRNNTRVYLVRAAIDMAGQCGVTGIAISEKRMVRDRFWEKQKVCLFLHVS